MKIGILSDCRVPTMSDGGHGLGRLAYRINDGLSKHDVTLYGGIGSVDGCEVHKDEASRALLLDIDAHDIWIDLSHHHDLSKKYPDAPILNYIVDLECPYQPPNALTCNPWHQTLYPASKVLVPGISVTEHNLIEEKKDYLTFSHKLHPAKGVGIALEIAQRIDIPVKFVGENFINQPVPNYTPTIDSHLFYKHLGEAKALLSPTLRDAGGMVNLEAAAVGTPVICLDTCGTQHYVEHCVSGFICKDLDEMVDAIQDIQYLDPKTMHEWVADNYTTKHMIDALETYCQGLMDGERW